MKVFADTFFYLAQLDSDDSAHERAISAIQQLDSVTVTTAWVLLELGDRHFEQAGFRALLR